MMYTVQEQKSDYPQTKGEVECRLVYLHSNGEYEGFSALGKTQDEAYDNCVERIRFKLQMMNQTINNKRIFGESVLKKLPALEASFIKDDFQYSKRGEKL